MATHEPYMAVSPPRECQMTVPDYNYQSIAQPEAFAAGLPTPLSSQYCSVDYSGSYLTPETTVADFQPMPAPGEQPYLGLNLSAVHSFESFLPTRPHSSPSTFGPNEQELVWTGSPERQISGATTVDVTQHPFWNPSTFPPVHAPGPRHRYSSSASISEIKTPQPRRPYPVLVPNLPPAQIMSGNSMKRTSSEQFEEQSSPEMTGIMKRRKTTPVPMNPPTPELSDEDRLLLRLKDEEHVSWKDIASRFQSELGKVYQVPALQMRLKRLRERLRVWSDADVQALRLAHEHWERHKFEIIASKMVEFGANEKWTARQCSKKWQEMNQGMDIYATQSVPTPAFSYTSSPIEQSTPTFAPPPFIGIQPQQQ